MHAAASRCNNALNAEHAAVLLVATARTALRPCDYVFRTSKSDLAWERLALHTYQVYLLSEATIISAEMIDAPSPSEAAAIGTQMASCSPWHSLLADRIEVWDGAHFHHSAPLQRG